MTKKDLISQVVTLLRDNGITKKISTPKHTFHISDDMGNHKDFVVRNTEKEVFLNSNDIGAVVDACLFVIQESLKQGEEVSIHGFGTLGLHHRAERKTKRIGTDEWVTVDARYVPKFAFGNDLRLAAKIYELSLQDRSSQNGGDA